MPWPSEHVLMIVIFTYPLRCVWQRWPPRGSLVVMAMRLLVMNMVINHEVALVFISMGGVMSTML